MDTQGTHLATRVGAMAASPQARMIQQDTHSAQTSFDFDALFPNLRTRSRGRVEASDQQLQTSFDFDDAYSSRRATSGTNTSAPPSPLKALKATTGAPVAHAPAGGVSELTEPWAHSLISTLRSVAEEVALLREVRLAPPPPPASAGACEREGEASNDRNHGKESDGQGASKASKGMEMEAWLRAGKFAARANDQVCSEFLRVLDFYVCGACVCVVLCCVVLCCVPDSLFCVVRGLGGGARVCAGGRDTCLKSTRMLQVDAGGAPDVSFQAESDARVQADSPPDTSTSLSSGEFRDPLSVLAMDTSFTVPDSPPHSQPAAQQPRYGMQSVGASQTRFPLTFSGPAASLDQRRPWREGGPPYPESLAATSRSELRAERRAERSRLRRLRQLRQNANSTTASFMTGMEIADITATSATPRTDSELSDGELAASVVWWLGEPAGESAEMKGTGVDSEISDGEIRQST